MGDFETVKEAASLKDYAEQHLTRGRDRGTFVCPLCESGTGKNKSAAFSIMPDGKKWHCFSCDETGDIYDLAGILGNTDSRAEQLKIVADWAGVPLEERKPRGFQETMNARAAVTPVEAREEEKGTDTAQNLYAAGRERHRRYIAECAERLKNAYTSGEPMDAAALSVDAYLKERGITPEDAMEIGLGYDPKPAHGWKDDAGEWHNTPRLIIPWAGSDYYHIDRAVDSRAATIKYDKPPSVPNEDRGVTVDMCVGEQPLYNPSAFDQSYIVVVEGALDAIALQLCGYNSVALGGTAVNDFTTAAAERAYRGVVIDMLDADGTSDKEAKNRKGRGAGADLVSLLENAGVACLARSEYGVGEADDYAGCKDAGELFAQDRGKLADMLEDMRDKALEKARKKSEADYYEAMRHLNVKEPERVALDLLDMRGIYDPVETGIKTLDDALDGGLNLGELTILGAISSYGKTTLTSQIADNMAKAGRSVLFVTIEQSARELISKSLSRIIYYDQMKRKEEDGDDEPLDHIITPSEIMSRKERLKWKADRKWLMARAVETYNTLIAPNMRILEGTAQPTVDNIRAVANVMAEHDGKAPIVFLDYLQLLAPKNDRDTDKQAADYNVSELRKMARDLNTHIWAISSLNRESYTSGVSMTSFKESGSLEYGSDNLMGLQVRGLYEKIKDKKGSDAKIRREVTELIQENKTSTEREAELVVLKRRNGALPPKPLAFTFKPLAAQFDPLKLVLYPDAQEGADGEAKREEDGW